MPPLLAILLALQPAAGAGRAADWWYVSASGDAGDYDAHYADRASIRRDGDHVFIREAREGERPGENGILGSRVQAEYDCRARTGRFLTATFLGPDGILLEDVDPGETLHPVEPRSVYGGLMRFACGEGEGLEQLGALGIREHALLLFREMHARPATAN
ncbi:MAG: hypothetical protein QOD42_2986 [Sphingomonadales bacterium]|nr:hypothetical protein [Sphingomonadales bacterium]